MYQFKSLSFVSALMTVGLPFVLIGSMVYYYYKIFALKQLNRVDLIIFLFMLIPIYNAFTVHYTLDQPLMKALIKVASALFVTSASLSYYMIRTNRLTIKQYVLANVVLCWFTLFFYTYVSFTVNPATFTDGSSDGLVGYNPVKGGYIFRFSSSFLMFGMVYYFLQFILQDKFTGLFAFLILCSYQVFVDKGRSEFVSEMIPLFLYMFIVLKWHQTFKKLFQLFGIIGFICLILYFVYPEALKFTADMYIVFVKFLLGKKTGEGSADVRWEEMAAVYNYFERHPTHIFFGIGVPKKLVMTLNVGNVVLGDIGIVGGLLSNGIVGVIVINTIFLYPIYIAYKMKIYKRNIYYNTGLLGICSIFIQSLFSGAIYAGGFGFILFFLIVEYYRAKEQQYLKAVAANPGVHIEP
ncbi:MAG: hypothetical protein U0U67_04520 [Chitinophagales bacterium]